MANQGKRMVSEDQIKKLEDLDLSQLQPKLTAGDNITIENNVISAAGGNDKYYDHLITVIDTNDDANTQYSLTIRNKLSTPFTYTDLYNYVSNNGNKVPATVVVKKLDTASAHFLGIGSYLFTELNKMTSKVYYYSTTYSGFGTVDFYLSTNNPDKRTFNDTVIEL